jgi:ubiquitin C-terminal hydrolase
MSFKVCEPNYDPKYYTAIEAWSFDTLLQLKDKVAYYLKIYLPLNKLLLVTFDEKQKKWIVIGESNPSDTISQSGLSAGSTLSIKYRDPPVSTNPRPNNSTSVVNQTNDELWLKLCKKPKNRTDYIYFKIHSFATLRDLRIQAYEELNKPSKGQPIYLWNNGDWMKFEPDMDDCLLTELSFESYVYISIAPAEENSNSKHPSGICGLANLGNTCYMNSVFQCLSNTPAFTQRILALNDNEVNAPITGNYMKLIKKMWSGNTNFIEPTSLLDSINDNLPRYSTYRQQDAQEFMNHFLHLIHAELSTKETLITELFYGQIRSSVKCLECKQTESTNESISFLPLPISNYHQKTVLYIKANGEQHLVPMLTDSSVTFVNDLIDFFVKQHESKMPREQIQARRLVNNDFIDKYSDWQYLTDIREEELAFLEFPKKSHDEKHIWCEFHDHSTHKRFRPATVLTCPSGSCLYSHISDQIEQLLGHLCSMTGASVSDCYVYWIDRYRDHHQLDIEASTDASLPRLDLITIEMNTKWIDIYKTHYKTNSSADNSGLSGLLSDFFHEEPLDGDYHCLKCSKHTKARQKSDLCLPLPRVLIIQLKRFTYDTYSNNKIDTYISFPLYDLDLNEYITKDNNDKQENKSSTKYDLVAVSNHTGSLSGGHYTTYAKNHQDGNWYSFDDSYVRKLDGDNDIVTKNAYILVYVQKTNENK